MPMPSHETYCNDNVMLKATFRKRSKTTDINGESVLNNAPETLLEIPKKTKHAKSCQNGNQTKI
eukprot:4359687-Amphidinium_carterae.1